MGISILKRSWLFAVLLCAATFIGAALQSANASEQDPAPPPGGWEFSMTPYGWVNFITGDQTAGGNTSSINTNVFDILQEVDEIYYWASYQEARKGKLGLYADVYWVRPKFGIGGVKNIDGIPGAPGLHASASIVTDADVTIDLAIIDPGIAFEITNRSTGGSLKDPVPSMQSMAIDVVAGARYWYLRPDADVDVSTTINIPALGISRTGSGSISAKKTIDWWDPYIGLRLRQQRGPGKELVLRGDIGGFGVGSDFTWQAVGAYTFNTRILGHNAIGMVGYKALYVDYSEGKGAKKLGFDWLWHGPTLGLKFPW
jgi:hypothetical protein